MVDNAEVRIFIYRPQLLMAIKKLGVNCLTDVKETIAFNVAE